MKSDVVIVGSGVAGVSIARRLLETGRAGHITLIEAGQVFRMMDHRIWLDFVSTGRRPDLPFRERESDYELAKGNEVALDGARLFCGGGSTNHWGGWSFRLKPEDFELRSRTGRGADWPISYVDLQPWYAKAELYIGVSGDAAFNDPPRAGAPYTNGPVPFTLKDDFFIRAYKTQGITYQHLPIARRAERCVTTSTCRYCPVGAKYSGSEDLRLLLEDYAPEKLTLLSGAPAARLVMDGDRAVAVEIAGFGAHAGQRIEGETIILAAGSIETAKLLLQSRDGRSPEGLGNGSGHVGRHLTSHGMSKVVGTLSPNDRNYEHELDFPTLCSRHYDTPAEQRTGKIMMIHDNKTTKEDFAQQLLKGATPGAIERRLRGSKDFEMSAFVEEHESPESRVGIAPGVNRFGLPKTRISYVITSEGWAARRRAEKIMSDLMGKAGLSNLMLRSEPRPRGDHLVGTCRMSEDAANGVVDRDLRVFGTKNVYICSNAVFPNVAAVNPTLTLVALSLRFADGFGRRG